MSVNKTRRAGSPAFPRQGPTLRLVKDPDERPRPEPAPELKAIVEELNHGSRARREQSWQKPDGKDAA